MAWRFPGREGDDFGPPPPPFRFRRRSFNFRSFGGYNRWVFIGVLLIVLFVVLDQGKTIYIDWLWFDGVGFKSVYAKRITTELILFFGGAAIFIVFFGTNVYLAARLALQTPARGIAEAEAASLRRLYAVLLIAGTLFFGIVFGSIAAGHWTGVLTFFNAQSFGTKDPQFHRDIGFFVFKLPTLRFFYGWLMGMTILTTLASAGLYLFRYVVIGEARDSRQTKAHLCLLLVAVVALFIWRYWLDRFQLDFSTSGVVFGATYTDVHARLPLIYIGMVLAGATALTLLYTAFRGGISAAIAVMSLWAAVSFLGGLFYPASVRRLTVQPNELEKERPYIQRNIDLTRQAFGLDKLEERAFPAQASVTQQEITANPQTIGNIRLLDVRPLVATYNQIQALRPLYEFRDVDVDRYVIDGQLRQVMLSARELSPSRLPVTAQTWVNKRLQYTHGYGVIMSPVNEVVQEGLPSLFMQDIPVTGKIPLTQPQIYYGEEPDHYVIVKSKAKEFDYPVGDGNVQDVYTGNGGVKLGSIVTRMALMWQFGDPNILISSSLTKDSRVLFRRNVPERVKELAPFLRLDQDPYLVIADGKMYWIQDAYTTTDQYPYSKPDPAGYNYIRNSVKVVVSAYDGSTTFYVADPTDPIIKTYEKIFPKMFTPLDQMPASLQQHLRYPEDMFLSQVNQYRTYHITDPGVLYNKEDIWSIPTEQFTGTSVQVMPYYVIMRIPGETQEEFALILPLTPSGGRQNTIAWVAARSDGANYGKLLSFRFPTDVSVFGPSQVESRIDQDPDISAQFSLWNQSGSQVIRGNLLMIPIGTGNLFVEPIYLQAQTSQLPELKRVVVVNGNNIAMEDSLDHSLAVVFGAAASTPPTADNPTGTSPSPTSGTPGPTATPNPTSTAAPQGTPGSVADLAKQAEDAFQQAQDALKNADFATYGQKIALAQSLIQQIVQASGP